MRAALGRVGFRFEAGQSALIGLAASAVRVPYSLACAPAESREGGYLEFLIKVEPSGRWGHAFERLARGQRLAVRGPFGAFVLPATLRREPLLFVAGGTGIAPIRAMVAQVLRKPHGPVRVIYSARTASDFAYARELRALARRRLIDVRFHATRRAPDGWRGARGRIAPAHLAPFVQDRSTRCFVCGPSAMVADLPIMLTRLGVPRRHIALEQWG